MDAFKVPRIWPGIACAILAGGPSIKSLDLTLLQGWRVIAVTNSYKLGNWDVCYFGDEDYLIKKAGGVTHRQNLLRFAGLKITDNPDAKDEPGIRRLRRDLRYGISTNPEVLCWNNSSGGAAINLAVHFGVSKIVLLGYDMQLVAGENNWHKDHGHESSHDPYWKFLEPMPVIARELARLGVDVVNATPGSALTVFPIQTPEEALRRPAA